MESRHPENVTHLLAAMRAGDGDAANRLLPLLYDELRSVARRLLSRGRRDHTLETTALVHEVYLRLIGASATEWRDEAHFLAVASKAMRQILIDHFRARKAVKRGGDYTRLQLSDDFIESLDRNDGVLALNDALDRLAVELPEHAQAVEMRFFGGMAPAEIAVARGASERTIRRQLAFAKAWLRRELAPTDQG
ncbi:MAG: hypothetical protein CHACPFDD_03545 [Phycisphaerae bacterium]|nr:hypothetical protein [Phycisphaerae bacterium]